MLFIQWSVDSQETALSNVIVARVVSLGGTASFPHGLPVNNTQLTPVQSCLCVLFVPLNVDPFADPFSLFLYLHVGVHVQNTTSSFIVSCANLIKNV